MIGEIMLYAGEEIPEGWLLCNGQYLDAQEYPALSVVLGKAYSVKGGKFRIPELLSPINNMTGKLETETHEDLSADQRVVLDAKRDKNLKYIICAFEPEPPQPEQPQG